MKKDWFDKIVETNDSIIVTITKEDAYNELYEDCEREHSGCNRGCPVYDMAVDDEEFDINKSNPCPYFKNGKAMFERLQGKRLSVKEKNGVDDS